MALPILDRPGAGSFAQPRPARMALRPRDLLLSRVVQSKPGAPYSTWNISNDSRDQPQRRTARGRVCSIVKLHQLNTFAGISWSLCRLAAKQCAA